MGDSIVRTSGPTLDQVLRALGYGHRRARGLSAPLFAHEIARVSDGARVFVGRAGEVWAWLRGEVAL